jgi:hypothetical protein
MQHLGLTALVLHNVKQPRTLHFHSLSTHFPFSFLLFLPSISLPPCEGRAERRWRLDACDAPRSACHDRHADASLDPHRGKASPCVHCAPRADPACDRFAQPGPRSPACVEASCVPSDGDARLAALHVGFLARARACRCPACPPRSCGNLICRTGHRYPEERVSRASPARSLTASGTPQPRSALQERP